MRASNNKIRVRQYLAVILGNIINVSFGTTIAWYISNVNNLKTSDTPLQVPPLNENEINWIGTIQYCGAVIGTIFLSFMGDGFGRKNTLMVMAIPQLASFALILLSTNATELYIARFLSGFVGGGTIVLMALFTTELSEYNSNGRGTMLSIIPLAISAGSTIEYTAYILLNYQKTACVMISVTIAFLIGFGYFWDTPQQLCSMAHKHNEAEKSLRFYRMPFAYVDTILDPYKIEIKKIRHHLRAEEITRKDFGTLSALKATTIAIVLILLHGFCDSFATSETIRKVLYEKMDSAKCKMILGYCNLFGILICTTLVDKIGRKILIVISTIGSAFCFIFTGMLHNFLLKSTTSFADVQYIGSFLLICLHCFIVFLLALGIIPLIYVLIPEIFPEKIRSINVTIAFGLLWLMEILLIKYGTSAMLTLGVEHISYILAAISILSAIFFISVLPETKKKNFDEILILMDR